MASWKVPYIDGKPQFNAALRHAPEYRDNEPFQATLTVSSSYFGQGSGKVYLRDEAGIRYEMFPTDFLAAMHRNVRGVLTGWWAFRKCGKVLGLVTHGDNDRHTEHCTECGESVRPVDHPRVVCSGECFDKRKQEMELEKR